MITLGALLYLGLLALVLAFVSAAGTMNRRWEQAIRETALHDEDWYRAA